MISYLRKMRRFVIFLIASFLFETISTPLLAQGLGDSRFQHPLVEEGGVKSFRKGGGQSPYEGGTYPPGTLLEKGSLITEPSMGAITYQVHVSGEVRRPGTYRVLASERLSEVLERAGGLSENASNRRIIIKRGGGVEKVVDLLKFNLYGNLDHNPYLQDNDIVYVPLRQRTVEVVGAVKRPDVYELASEKTLSEVVRLAGGYSSGLAETEPIRVVRFVDGKKEVVELAQHDPETGRFEIQNGDVIYVPSVITAGHKFDYNVSKVPGGNVFYPSYEDRVFVLGGVNFPGAYPFNPYYNIHQYISLAGGFTNLATGKIRILRPDGKRYTVKPNQEFMIDPGDTILVGYRRIPPEGWVNLAISLASFGLSAASTIFLIKNR